MKEAEKVREGFRLVVERLRRIAKEPSKVPWQDRRFCGNDCKATGNFDGVFEDTSSLSWNIDDARTSTTAACDNTASGFEIIRCGVDKTECFRGDFECCSGTIECGFVRFECSRTKRE